MNLLILLSSPSLYKTCLWFFVDDCAQICCIAIQSCQGSNGIYNTFNNRATLMVVTCTYKTVAVVVNITSSVDIRLQSD